MSSNSYFVCEAGPTEYNTIETLHLKAPLQNQAPRIQIQEAVQVIQNEVEDDSAAAFYRELRLQSEEKRRQRGF
jgi:hypothetical protein